MDLETFLKESATPSLVQAISAATTKAEATGTATHLGHLAEALIAESSVSRRIPNEIAIRARAAVAEQLAALPSIRNGEKSPGVFAFDLAGFARPAIRLAKDWNAEKVSPLALLAAILSIEGIQPKEESLTQEALRAAGLTVNTLMPAADPHAVARSDFTYKSLGFGTDLTQMARAGIWSECPLVGMDRELRRLVMLMSAGSDSVVVVGEPGVGKSAIVHGLAWHLANATRPLVPTGMESYTVVSISTTNMLAGTAGRGELEDRLDHMLDFFRKNPTVIPFFDEIHTLLDSDDTSSRAVSTALKPPMVNGQFRCIGATTDKEYARFIANDEAMNSRFTRLLLPEPDQETTVKILRGVLGNLVSKQAREQGLDVEEAAIKAVVRLTGRYQRNDGQPRKSIQLIKRAIAEKTYALQTGEVQRDTALTIDDVAHTFSEISGVPVDDLDDQREDFYASLREQLGDRVKGQAEAIDGITAWLALHANGWLDARRPRGRFLFLGPPGVGKTELALTLAEQVMRDRGSLVSRNMGEYKGEGARTRFMGSDPGYVGFGQVSTIYSEIMMRPYSVVVLDEFEKAHPSLSDLLLSVLDGRAADAQGRNVDFSQCIFVMTSNAIHESLGELPSEELLRRRLVELGGIWTAPLVDRIDRIVLFRPLSNEVLLQILDDMIVRRRSHAARPLPGALDNKDERLKILGWATEGEGHASARRLERALLRALSASSQAETENANMEQRTQTNLL